jgi:hypothetical protein
VNIYVIVGISCLVVAGWAVVGGITLAFMIGARNLSKQ